MRIIQLGGLGNQMFIYALYYALKRKGIDVQIDASLYNLIRMHNGYELPNVFEVAPPDVFRRGIHTQWLRFMLHFKPSLLVYEERFNRSLDVFSVNKPYITGYWQSDMYFSDYREDLLKLFSFKGVSQRNMSLSEGMQSSHSVSIHIRRGDYLTVPGAMSSCTEDYYRKAINIIYDYVQTPYFYIFSNDVEWSQNFAKKLGIPFTIIDHNKGKDSYQDMFLMTQCKHNIIANSSFSWWGAYLNQHKDSIVIAPHNWCVGHSEETLESDTPKDWIRI